MVRISWSDRPLPANWLLAGLPPRARARLRPLLDAASLAPGQVLARPGERFDYVYFLETSMASIVSSSDDGAGVEVGVVGREGMVGLPVVLGARRAPPLDVFVQIPGDGWRMKTAALRLEMECSPVFRQRLFSYAQARLAQLSQSVACNARHPIRGRLARWLLMAREAVRRDELPLTQRFLSMMLGVRRAGVTVAAGSLQRAGLIRYTPGSVTILDPAGLEASACKCFRTVQSEYERLLGSAPAAVSAKGGDQARRRR